MSGLETDIVASKCDEVYQRATAEPGLSQSEADHGLLVACKLSCSRCAEAMLRAGAATEARDAEHYTPLIKAAQKGDARLVKLLLDWDCEVNSAGGTQSHTALHVSAAEGYLDCCQLLVAGGATVNAQNSQEDTPLILASLHGHLPIVRFLLSHHASIRKRGYHERTALHCAAEGGHLSVCRYLVSAKANLEEEDTFGNTPLICAAEKGVGEVLEVLLGEGCDVNRMSHSAATALHYAAQHGALQACRVLLKAGAEIDAQDIRRFTPLMMSSLNGYSQVVALLIEWKCNVNMASYNRRTALHLAAERGKQDCCELLLNAGAFIDAQDTAGSTPVHVAILKGQIQMMQFLMACGADTVRRPNNGNSLMHMAAAGGSEQCCQLLWKQGFDINEQNSDGNTPLCCAVHNKQVSTAGFLLRAGCQVDRRGMHGMTALNEATFLSHHPLLSTLLLHGADPAIPDDAGTLPLWFAIDNCSADSVRLLLAAGSPFLTRSTLSPALGPCDPLEYAAHKQRALFVDWILAAGGETAANCLRRCLPRLEESAGLRGWVSLARWREASLEPQSLLLQCRCAIRRCLRRDVALLLPDSLKGLALPQVLKAYLALADLPAPTPAEEGGV